MVQAFADEVKMQPHALALVAHNGPRLHRHSQGLHGRRHDFLGKWTSAPQRAAMLSVPHHPDRFTTHLPHRTWR
eukprot:6208916-Pleurochrysis_carterae.AAC.3